MFCYSPLFLRYLPLLLSRVPLNWKLLLGQRNTNWAYPPIKWLFSSSSTIAQKYPTKISEKQRLFPSPISNVISSHYRLPNTRYWAKNPTTRRWKREMYSHSILNSRASYINWRLWPLYRKNLNPRETKRDKRWTRTENINILLNYSYLYSSIHPSIHLSAHLFSLFFHLLLRFVILNVYFYDRGCYSAYHEIA